MPSIFYCSMYMPIGWEGLRMPADGGSVLFLTFIWKCDQGELSEDDSNNLSGNPEGRDSTKEKYNKGHIVIPYIQGLGESIKI